MLDPAWFAPFLTGVDPSRLTPSHKRRIPVLFTSLIPQLVGNRHFVSVLRLLWGTEETLARQNRPWQRPQLSTFTGVKGSKSGFGNYMENCISTAKELHATSTSADESNTA